MDVVASSADSSQKHEELNDVVAGKIARDLHEAMCQGLIAKTIHLLEDPPQSRLFNTGFRPKAGALKANHQVLRCVVKHSVTPTLPVLRAALQSLLLKSPELLPLGLKIVRNLRKRQGHRSSDEVTAQSPHEGDTFRTLQGVACSSVMFAAPLHLCSFTQDSEIVQDCISRNSIGCKRIVMTLEQTIVLRIDCTLRSVNTVIASAVGNPLLQRVR
jgi:hypothetical protein